MTRLHNPDGTWQDNRTGDDLERPWLRPEPIGGVWLDRDGEYIVVRILRADGWYYEAIREHQEAGFSHSISAEGIRHLDTPVPWLDKQ